MSTPAMLPALRLRSARMQPPAAGKQIAPFGSGVFSFGAPAHQRVPLKSDSGGFPLRAPRPYEVRRQTPEARSPARPYNEYVLSPPNTLDFALSRATASNGAATESSWVLVESD